MSTKKPTAAQLAARKLFAARVKAGVFSGKREHYTAGDPVERAEAALRVAKKTAAARKQNPLSRVKVESPPQRPAGTKAKPSPRLQARRSATQKAPKGYYANPEAPASQYRIPEEDGEWRLSYAKNNRFIAMFYKKSEAIEYANALAAKSGKQLKLERV